VKKIENLGKRYRIGELQRYKALRDVLTNLIFSPFHAAKGILHKMQPIENEAPHGFQTLVDQSELFYQMSKFYQPESARGVRWNDTAFQIEWPISNLIISPKDLAYPDIDENGISSK
jgi:hypothetical protein